MPKKTKLVAAIMIAAASFAVYSGKNYFQEPQSSKSTPTQTPSQVISAQQDLAKLEYEGTQTIEINQNNPTFSKEDLSTANGPWAKYGDLDHLNRATDAEALLNKKLMPTEKRGEISSVTPTGWHNKKTNGQYLFNRSHLIGYQLTGENANWKNLITGTRQLNSPEMLRFEMDIKYYLEKSPKNYVRYSVVPVFRGDELLARGVHMMAQSIGSDDVQFNVYIFNVQNGVTLNYADGTSTVGTTSQTSTSETAPLDKEYVDSNGKGLIKGSKSGVYHLPGSKYYDQTTNPRAWFKTIEEAKKAGYRAAK
ncbi:DNA/RNA non-specific endonuclease [Enterococcus hulanensis]|uniref:DNA/RNA non-specific endonuclease n=1 Tax=Enterococcus hulanensis TaxID=2559929 RepID=UPI002891D96C|nr:DNA/RNA non-specific endonuclease [Enterococcus hulanensis]MDT2659754.1 DNA/RNA non-specific endonuclease [Enterococcus hulanensis]